MQLDKTRVVIRERGWLDILDLSLCLFRTRGLGILVMLILGVLPWAALNYWLLQGAYRNNLHDSSEVSFWYFIILPVIETPLATAPLTLYLGQTLFLERVDWRALVRNLVQSLPQLILFQVILRTLLIVPLFTIFIPYCVWPYLNEIILLERNPIVARNKNQISTRSRTSALHSGLGAELVARALATLTLIGVLSSALYSGFHFLRMVLGMSNEVGWWGTMLDFPLAFWLVIGLFTVVRFLCYLDARIRREGWEVELRLRAEAARLMRQPT